MTTFLPEGKNFQDLSVKTRPDLRTDGAQLLGIFVLCPLCQGHGGWNLQLHAYGEGKHFQAFCRQCWGWGWVKAGTRDVDCVHEFKEVKPDQPFRCWHTIECTACGERRSYSSDD